MEEGKKEAGTWTLSVLCMWVEEFDLYCVTTVRLVRVGERRLRRSTAATLVNGRSLEESGCYHFCDMLSLCLCTFKYTVISQRFASSAAASEAIRRRTRPCPLMKLSRAFLLTFGVSPEN